MPIDWDADPREFHLRTGRTSYVMRVLEGGALGLLHFGAPLAGGRSYRHLVSREFRGFSNRLGETVALEYPTPGVRDYRIPALAVDLADGSTAIELGYVGHRILAGKPSIPGLPSTYAEADGEAETLEVTLADPAAGVEVRLRYSAFGDLPVVVRGAIVRNLGDRALTIRCAMSASLDLPDARWHLVQLSGIWARERHVVIRPLAPGRTSVGSLRGASGHEHNPFVALIRPTTTEDQGEAIGFSLVYSGNFLAEAEVRSGPPGFASASIPSSSAWRLEPGEELATPEAVVAWTDRGFGGLTDAYHGLYRERLARGAWRDRARPVLLNTWEGRVRLRRGTPRGDGAVGSRDGDRTVRPRRRLVRAAR